MQLKQSKWIYLFVLSLIWGSSFILIKKSLIGLTPLQLGALRILISGLFIFLFGFYKLKSVKRKYWKWLIISGFLGTFFPSFLFAFAETEIDSAVASILNSLVPLNTILMGFAVFKIASTKRQVLGVIIGFTGTAILIGKGAQLNPGQNYLYAGLVVISAIMYAANVNIIKKYLQEVNALTIATGNFASIVIPAFIVLLFTKFFTSETFNQPELKQAIVYVIILSAFGTALAKVMFNKLVQMSTPVFASSVTYLMPIVAVVWGLLDGESFSFVQGLATLLILAGVYLANRRK
ncbi:MAG: EamA family transporter [Bacteroidia bacterium]|nr:EamA family transporter [Bacteroidia bacterium]NND25244.1 EamA family transporter [Flavobacteriaceae bacterium]MBT8277492.1 EamA family transporter [Bacteroidia bacterium]NNK61403.1 EamA family transporter [Flavobacteriaceae bacterium]NNL32796.1 EamA family transporter [Flavobacteriaceae bacterium]